MRSFWRKFSEHQFPPLKFLFYLKLPHWTITYGQLSFSQLLRYSDLPAGTPQSGRGCCIFQVGRNPYKFGKETKSHLGLGRKKNYPPGLTIWDCWVLPCKTNTQQEGFAFLTKSQLAPSASAAGGRVRVRGWVDAGSPGWRRAGYRRWKGCSTWCWQCDFASLFLSPLQAMLMFMLKNWELMIFMAFLSDLSWECQVGKNKT